MNSQRAFAVFVLFLMAFSVIGPFAVAADTLECVVNDDCSACDSCVAHECIPNTCSAGPRYCPGGTSAYPDPCKRCAYPLCPDGITEPYPDPYDVNIPGQTVFPADYFWQNYPQITQNAFGGVTWYYGPTTQNTCSSGQSWCSVLSHCVNSGENCGPVVYNTSSGTVTVPTNSSMDGLLALLLPYLMQQQNKPTQDQQLLQFLQQMMAMMMRQNNQPQHTGPQIGGQQGGGRAGGGGSGGGKPGGGKPGGQNPFGQNPLGQMPQQLQNAADQARRMYDDLKNELKGDIKKELEQKNQQKNAKDEENAKKTNGLDEALRKAMGDGSQDLKDLLDEKTKPENYFKIPQADQQEIDTRRNAESKLQDKCVDAFSSYTTATVLKDVKSKKSDIEGITTPAPPTKEVKDKLVGSESVDSIIEDKIKKDSGDVLGKFKPGSNDIGAYAIQDSSAKQALKAFDDDNKKIVEKLKEAVEEAGKKAGKESKEDPVIKLIEQAKDELKKLPAMCFDDSGKYTAAKVWLRQVATDDPKNCIEAIVQQAKIIDGDKGVADILDSIKQAQASFNNQEAAIQTASASCGSTTPHCSDTTSPCSDGHASKCSDISTAKTTLDNYIKTLPTSGNERKFEEEYLCEQKTGTEFDNLLGRAENAFKCISGPDANANYQLGYGTLPATPVNCDSKSLTPHSITNGVDLVGKCMDAVSSQNQAFKHLEEERKNVLGTIGDLLAEDVKEDYKFKNKQGTDAAAAKTAASNKAVEDAQSPVTSASEALNKFLLENEIYSASDELFLSDALLDQLDALEKKLSSAENSLNQAKIDRGDSVGSKKVLPDAKDRTKDVVTKAEELKQKVESLKSEYPTIDGDTSGGNALSVKIKKAAEESNANIQAIEKSTQVLAESAKAALKLEDYLYGFTDSKKDPEMLSLGNCLCQWTKAAFEGPTAVEHGKYFCDEIYGGQSYFTGPNANLVTAFASPEKQDDAAPETICEYIKTGRIQQFTALTDETLRLVLENEFITSNTNLVATGGGCADLICPAALLTAAPYSLPQGISLPTQNNYMSLQTQNTFTNNFYGANGICSRVFLKVENGKINPLALRSMSDGALQQLLKEQPGLLKDPHVVYEVNHRKNPAELLSDPNAAKQWLETLKIKSDGLNLKDNPITNIDLNGDVTFRDAAQHNVNDWTPATLSSGQGARGPGTYAGGENEPRVSQRSTVTAPPANVRLEMMSNNQGHVYNGPAEIGRIQLKDGKYIAKLSASGAPAITGTTQEAVIRQIQAYLGSAWNIVGNAFSSLFRRNIAGQATDVTDEQRSLTLFYDRESWIPHDGFFGRVYDLVGYDGAVSVYDGELFDPGAGNNLYTFKRDDGRVVMVGYTPNYEPVALKISPYPSDGQENGLYLEKLGLQFSTNVPRNVEYEIQMVDLEDGVVRIGDLSFTLKDFIGYGILDYQLGEYGLSIPNGKGEYVFITGDQVRRENGIIAVRNGWEYLPETGLGTLTDIISGFNIVAFHKGDVIEATEEKALLINTKDGYAHFTAPESELSIRGDKEWLGNFGFSLVEGGENRKVILDAKNELVVPTVDMFADSLASMKGYQFQFVGDHDPAEIGVYAQKDMLIGGEQAENYAYVENGVLTISSGTGNSVVVAQPQGAGIVKVVKSSGRVEVVTGGYSRLIMDSNGVRAQGNINGVMSKVEFQDEDPLKYFYPVDHAAMGWKAVDSRGVQVCDENCVNEMVVGVVS